MLIVFKNPILLLSVLWLNIQVIVELLEISSFIYNDMAYFIISGELLKIIFLVK
jgi:hypothetical protein